MLNRCALESATALNAFAKLEAPAFKAIGTAGNTVAIAAPATVPIPALITFCVVLKSVWLEPPAPEPSSGKSSGAAMLMYCRAASSIEVYAPPSMPAKTAAGNVAFK